MRLFLIPIDDVEHHWSRLESEFRRVVDRSVNGEFDVDDIKQLALDGHAHLAALEDKGGKIHMAIAFEFRAFPSGKLAVNVFAMGGRDLIKNMERFFPLFQNWCRSFGADWIECLVSDGMERMHLRSGFRTVYKQMRFDLRGSDDQK